MKLIFIFALLFTMTVMVGCGDSSRIEIAGQPAVVIPPDGSQNDMPENDTPEVILLPTPVPTEPPQDETEIENCFCHWHGVWHDKGRGKGHDKHCDEVSE